MRHIGFHYDVILGCCTFGHDVVGYVRDGEQELGLSLFCLGHLDVKLSDLCFECTGLRFGGFCLLTLTLRHECTDRLADLVHLRSSCIFELLSRLTLSIKTKHFVDCLCGA